MYGRYESTRTLPVLDACNGHWGPVPAYEDKGKARTRTHTLNLTLDLTLTLALTLTQPLP